jgi:hypothetical protein
MSNLKIGGLVLAAAMALSTTVVQGQMAPFGSKDDAAYAAALWSSLEKARLVGRESINTFPYEGTEPHGFVLETFYSKTSVNGHSGEVIVKRNYGPEDVEIEAVQADRGKHLAAVTVMFKREAGYDADNKDWFWAKFLPDGSLDKNPKGMMLAGKVAKGAKKGCIACHTGAPGDDMVFTK